VSKILLTVLAIGLGITAGVGTAQISTSGKTTQKTTTPKAQPVPATKAPAPAAHSVSAPATAKEGVTAQQDKQIEAAIRTKLAKSKIGKEGFTVRVQGGVAYWEGGTSVVQHKGSATRMAKTAGAHTVVNNIKVSDAAKQKAAANLDQGRRRAQVKRSDPRTQQ
jgi:BON domain